MVKCGNDSTSNVILSNETSVSGEKPLHFFLERYMDAYALEVKEFVNAIEHNMTPPVTVVDGLRPVIMGLAAKKSMEEHRPVRLDEIVF
jgi:myo-inositol 2-dehydrogenase/D-chiro-inositol 1-dehydrogenase